MKKVIALLFAVMLVASMGAVVFAAESSGDYGPGKPASVPVQATYEAAPAAEIYYVDVKWSGINFVYHAESAGQWDADEHTYSEARKAYWTSGPEGKSGQITVTNNSAGKDEGRVKVTLSFASAVGDTYGGTVTMKYADNEEMSGLTTENKTIYLEGSEVSGVAPSKTVFILPGSYGKLSDFGSATLGTITVSISALTLDDPGIPEQPGIG